MKSVLAKLFFLALVISATAKIYAQGDTNQGYTVESALKSVLVFVKPTEERYSLGEQMLVSVSITNTSQERIRLEQTIPDVDDYRISLYAADGTPVRSNDIVRTDMGMMNDFKTHTTLRIGPLQSISTTLDLTKWVRIEKEGTYYLTIARRIATWDSGFVVSDKVKINVVK